jgi:hypothetical protein
MAVDYEYPNPRVRFDWNGESSQICKRDCLIWSRAATLYAAPLTITSVIDGGLIQILFPWSLLTGAGNATTSWPIPKAVLPDNEANASPDLPSDGDPEGDSR